MNKRTLAVVAAMATVSTIGLLSVCGCRASMAVRDSEMPIAVSGALSGEYVLEKVASADCDFSEAELRTALEKDATLQSVFNGNAKNKDALPVTITVECTTKDVNGGVATVNNLVALCTLSLWPCVNSQELEYTLTASSVVGTHKTSFKVMNRSWFGISPVAMLPVPGIGDVRGDEAAVKKFHVAQIADAAKALCAELPKDYAVFKKDQGRYLEQISQARSESAFVAFRAASESDAKVDALAKMVNATVVAKHQDELVAAFKDEFDTAVRTAILAKLNDGSFDKLPYDPMLVSYWNKLGDSRLLAQVYRDGYAKLSDADRKSLVAKISDDAVLTEMVTPPSKDDLCRAQEKRDRQRDELKKKISEKQWEAENHRRSAQSAEGRFRFGEAKSENRKAEECDAQAAALQKKLAAFENAPDEGLYVKDDDARLALYGKVRPDVLASLFARKDFAEQVPNDKRTTLRGAYGSVYEDVKPEVAKELLAPVNDQEALSQIALGAGLFSIRQAAIEKLSDDSMLQKVASDKMSDCPYDTTLEGFGWGNGVKWMIETQEAGIGKLKRLAISRMKDVAALKKVRKDSDEESIKKAVSERLSALGFSDVDEIIACEKYDKDLFSMFAGLKKNDELTMVSEKAKLKGVRLLAASKRDATVFAAVAKKEMQTAAIKPTEGRMAVGGFYLGMGIEDMFAKLAAEYPDVKPTIYLDGKALCIAGGDGRDIAWSDAKSLDVHWITLPPSIVKKIAGFKTGSFENLKRAVEKKLGVSFGRDIIRKDSVSQIIGNLENTEGETLRYFIGEIGEGEDFSRTVRKVVNSNSAGNSPLDASVAGLSNAIEDAMQADENRANAKRPMFQLPGSLQLLRTESAVKGTLNAKGSFLKNASLGSALKAVGELGQKMEEVKTALKDSVAVKELQKSADDLKAAADTLNSLGQ